MRTAACVLVLVVSLLAGTAPVAGQTADVTLTVSVVTDSGDAVGGATIDATWSNGSTTATTASNGKAFIDVPEGADVSLDVESENYIRNTPLVVEGASEREVEVAVGPKGELTVAVNDTEGPVEDARVRLLLDGDTLIEGETDADGTYTTPAIEQGDYYLELFKPGYYRNLTLETVGESTTLNRSMRQGTANVQFRVVDDHFESPQQLSEARVEVADFGSQRLTSGTVTFTLPVNTRYTVTASKEGYESATTTFTLGTDPSERTLAINREPTLNLTATNERVVVGETVGVTVFNAYDEPVEGATVTVGGDAVATTNADGTARVPVETAGEATVVAELDGVTSNEVVLQGIATATATPEPTPTATATPTDTTPTTTEVEAPGMPGFTPLAAVVALLAVALLTGRFASRSR